MVYVVLKNDKTETWIWILDNFLERMGDNCENEESLSTVILWMKYYYWLLILLFLYLFFVHCLFFADIIVSKPVAGVVFSESQIIVGKDVSSFPEKLTENDEELNLDLADPENSVQSSPTRQEINSDLLTTTDQNGGKICLSFVFLV